MTLHLPRAVRRSDQQTGSAMVLAIVWSAILLALTGTVAAGVTQMIRPSDRSEATLGALAAAEAGLDDYRARLLKDNRYFLRGSEILGQNAALSGWAPMPGGDPAEGEFTYAVDTSRAFVAGELRVISTGRFGEETRTVEALLTKRSTLDYVYISDFETTAPKLPGTYSNYAEAQALCESRRWAASGLVNPNGTTGVHRNSEFCKWAGIYKTERLVGRVHTNDVWYLASDIKDALPTGPYDSTASFNGKVTSSCTPRVGSSQTGCPSNHRWIDTTAVGSGTGTFSSSPSYVANELPTPSSGYVAKKWNPIFDEVLEIPASNSRMQELANDSGCVFTGPTRIRFLNNGTMQVTSPATKSTRAFCGGTSLQATLATPWSQPTVVLNVADMERLGFNGVIYVQGSTAATTDSANKWAADTSPACLAKTTTNINAYHYPFVLPSLETGLPFASGYSGRKGFPSEGTDASQVGWYSCDAGDAYVQGPYKDTAVTLATDNDIILTGSTYDANDENTSNMNYTWTGLDADRHLIYGMPPLDSDNMLGLVPTRFLYIYRPLRNTGAGGSNPYAYTNDIDTTALSNPIYNFAAVVLNQCFGAQDATKGPASNNLSIRGSIGQRYRCPVGTSSNGVAVTGYIKNYQYDIRFSVEDPPPYMLELSNEPWRVEAYSETHVRRDPVAIADLPALPTSGQFTQTVNSTKLWDISASLPAGSRLTDVKIKAGSGTVNVSNAANLALGKFTLTTDTVSGTVILEYVVRKAEGYLAANTMTVKAT